MQYCSAYKMEADMTKLNTVAGKQRTWIRKPGKWICNFDNLNFISQIKWYRRTFN